MIDWESSETHVLLNPRLPASDRERLESLVARSPSLPRHVWLATSGTTGRLKVVALSKRALLASAAAVNRRLESRGADVWGCVLPSFHVGGLSIFARASLSGARVVEARWSALDFVRLCEAEGVTLTSLVPAQLRDLVNAGLSAPEALRAVVIGGGAVPHDLYVSASALGWPVLPSYGLTECCSQVATAKLGSPDLAVLDHVDVRAQADGRLELRSPALLTGYTSEDSDFVDPKVDGWLATEDLGEVDGTILRVSGRRGDFIKIGGESVDMARLDAILAEVADPATAALVAIEDERLGFVIALAAVGGAGRDVVDEFNRRVQPFERIRETFVVDQIPRTALGKLLRKRLRDSLRCGPPSLE